MKCDNCKKEYKPDEETMKRIKRVLDELPGEERASVQPDKIRFYTSH